MPETNEGYIVVWWDKSDSLYALTDDKNNIIVRPFDQIRDIIDEEMTVPDKHAVNRRYALSARLARDAFGWEVDG